MHGFHMDSLLSPLIGSLSRDIYEILSEAVSEVKNYADRRDLHDSRNCLLDISSSTGLFTHYCYANEVGRHTKPSKFWSDDGIQRTH